MKNLATLGRVLFALPFGILGLNHFIMYNYYLGQISSFIPGGGFTILLTGAILILVSIAIIIKKFVPLVCWVLAGLLFLFIVAIHIPHLIYATNPTESVEALIELFKDTSLMGGSILIASIYKEKNKT